MFTLIYLLLFVCFVYLLNEKIQHGPADADLTPTGKLAIPPEFFIRPGSPEDPEPTRAPLA